MAVVVGAVVVVVGAVVVVVDAVVVVVGAVVVLDEVVEVDADELVVDDELVVVAGTEVFVGHDGRHQGDEAGGGPTRSTGAARRGPSRSGHRTAGPRRAGTGSAGARIDDRHGPGGLADRTVDGRDRDRRFVTGATQRRGAGGVGRVDGL